MNIVNYLWQYICHPQNILIGLLGHFGQVLSDRQYLKCQYRLQMGKRLDLNNPELYTEKLQWLKLFDRRPEYTIMVDKYAVKDYVKSLIGEDYIIPTIGVWDNFEDIELDLLPNQFVLKTTHGGGNTGVVVCKDKQYFDVHYAKEKLNKSLHANLYDTQREWPYKNVKKRILAEQYMVDESGYELKDYKVFCFNGEPKMIDVDYNRSTKHQRNLYTPQWERINATLGYPSEESREIEKPTVLNKLLDLAKLLSHGIPHVRVDFYIINNKIYFGELTFFHGSGFEKSYPDSFDKQMGDWLTLPIKHT